MTGKIYEFFVFIYLSPVTLAAGILFISCGGDNAFHNCFCTGENVGHPFDLNDPPVEEQGNLHAGDYFT